MVVITGAVEHWGSAFARGFADHGASLAILDFDLDNAKPTAARFLRKNHQAQRQRHQTGHATCSNTDASNTLHFIHRRSRQSRRR